MKISTTLIALASVCDAFVPSIWQGIGREYAPSLAPLKSTSLPTIEELRTDPFMKQVSHSEQLVTVLASQENGDDSLALELLQAQLSHSDGIRGFFVTYLTALDENSPADWEKVPSALEKAMKAADAADLIPLACMNVVMPTGMITMHQEEELTKQSQTTAERGLRVLQTLLSHGNTLAHCRAILAVAQDKTSSTSEGDSKDEKLIAYWSDFFDKWGYKELQKRDIAQAMKSVLE